MPLSVGDASSARLGLCAKTAGLLAGVGQPAAREQGVRVLRAKEALSVCESLLILLDGLVEATRLLVGVGKAVMQERCNRMVLAKDSLASSQGFLA
jgi:hypothetical protein